MDLLEREDLGRPALAGDRDRPRRGDGLQLALPLLRDGRPARLVERRTEERRAFAALQERHNRWIEAQGQS